MTTSALLDPPDRRGWPLLALAVVVSALAHVLLAVGISKVEPARDEPVWLEMAVQVVEPEPRPDPVPEPEPPEPEVVPEPAPRPDPVQRPDPAPEPMPRPDPVETQPEPPPPEARPVARKVQGLSNDSFLPGGATGLAANVGNTTATAAGPERLALGEEVGEFVVLPYTSVGKPPKIKYKPRLDIPQSVIDAELEGRVEILLTIDAEGVVTEAVLVSTFHPDAATACLASMKKSRWRSGTRDGAPVVTTQVPYSCRFEMAVD